MVNASQKKTSLRQNKIYSSDFAHKK